MKNWKKYSFEFLSIFVAVVAAFALNNWNDNRRANLSENKILTEIANGLVKDLDDIRNNITGHEKGILACDYFRKALGDEEVKTDSVLIHFSALTRDFVSIQNIAGYESLKSKGLELIANDSLRLQIISLYEFDYSILRKLEEEYSEMQFHESYFKEFNQSIAPNFQFNDQQFIIGINSPLQIAADQRKILLLYLWKIQGNRTFILNFYSDVEHKIIKIRENIEAEIGG